MPEDQATANTNTVPLTQIPNVFGDDDASSENNQASMSVGDELSQAGLPSLDELNTMLNSDNSEGGATSAQPESVAAPESAMPQESVGDSSTELPTPEIPAEPSVPTLDPTTPQGVGDLPSNLPTLNDISAQFENQEPVAGEAAPGQLGVEAAINGSQVGVDQASTGNQNVGIPNSEVPTSETQVGVFPGNEVTGEAAVGSVTEPVAEPAIEPSPSTLMAAVGPLGTMNNGGGQFGGMSINELGEQPTDGLQSGETLPSLNINDSGQPVGGLPGGEQVLSDVQPAPENQGSLATETPVESSVEMSPETASTLPTPQISPEKAAILDLDLDKIETLSPLEMIDQQIVKLDVEVQELQKKSERLQQVSSALKKEIEQKQYSAQVIDYALNSNANRINECAQQKQDLMTARSQIAG